MHNRKTVESPTKEKHSILDSNRETTGTGNSHYYGKGSIAVLSSNRARSSSNNYNMPIKKSNQDSQTSLSDNVNAADAEDMELVLLNGDEEGHGSEKDQRDHMKTLEWLSFHGKKNIKVLTACGSYSFCSVSMVLVNKSLASSYNHLIAGDGDLNILLVVFQAIVAVFAVEISKQLKWVDIPSFSIETAIQWAPVNIFFCAMLFTGMASLQHNSVPMVTIFKNISNITTTLGEYYFFGNRPEALVLVAFGIMLLGAVAAAGNDMSINSVGLFWMLLNCLSCSGYLLYMKHATETIDLKKFGMVFYNNVLCVCFLLPAAIVMDQTKVFWESKVLHTPDYAAKNLFAGLVGFALNFASLSCVEAAGPTTYATIGSLNKIPVAFLGYWFFKSEISKETWFFIVVSMCGGFLYSYAKLRSSSMKRTTRRK